MQEATTTARRQIVVREIPYPASSLAVFKSIQHHPNCFFLDSALLKDDISRYSFMGYQPFLTLKAKGSHVKIQTNYNSVKKHVNPFTALRSLLKRFRLETNNLPVPFAGGAVGYLAYDLCHFIERLPATKPDDVGFPDMYFGFYDTVIAFDHVLNKCYIIAIDFDEDCQPYIQEKRPPAEERVEQIIQCGISSEFRVQSS